MADAAFLWWSSSGFPWFGDVGQELYDGEWTCWNGCEGGLGRAYCPGITVENGEVVEAHRWDMSAGQDVLAPFESVEVISPTELTLHSTYYSMDDGGDYLTSFTCAKD